MHWKTNSPKHIGKVPLLSPEEEIELAKRIIEGDEEAKARLTQANLRLVVSIANLWNIKRGKRPVQG